MTYDSFFKDLALEVRDIAKIDFHEAEAFVEKKLGVNTMSGGEFEAFLDTLEQNRSSLQESVIAQAEELAIQVCQTKSEARYFEQLRNDFSTANRN